VLGDTRPRRAQADLPAAACGALLFSVSRAPTTPHHMLAPRYAQLPVPCWLRRVEEGQRTAAGLCAVVEKGLRMAAEEGQRTRGKQVDDGGGVGVAAGGARSSAIPSSSGGSPYANGLSKGPAGGPPPCSALSSDA
jgi:hypothetical protein